MVPGPPGRATDPAGATVARAPGLGELDTAIRSWARTDPDVAERLSRVDAYRVGYLRRLMGQICASEREADLRTALAYAAAVGMRFAGSPPGLSVRAAEDVVAVLTTPGTLDLGPLDRG